MKFPAIIIIGISMLPCVAIADGFNGNATTGTISVDVTTWATYNDNGVIETSEDYAEPQVVNGVGVFYK